MAKFSIDYMVDIASLYVTIQFIPLREHWILSWNWSCNV